MKTSRYQFKSNPQDQIYFYILFMCNVKKFNLQTKFVILVKSKIVIGIYTFFKLESY